VNVCVPHLNQGHLSSYKCMFVLAFVVEFEIGYNSFMHKTQPQKLLFIAFLVGSTHKTPLPPQKQTPSDFQTRVIKYKKNQSDDKPEWFSNRLHVFNYIFFLRLLLFERWLLSFKLDVEQSILKIKNINGRQHYLN